MRYFITLGLLLISCTSFAAIEAYEFKTKKMESDYNVLINELRCLVCQNQNLAGSNSGLAKDLRKQTHELLTQGKSQDQVVQYMVDRYGDFVLYRPRLKQSTLLLWLGPFALLIVILIVVIFKMRRKQDLTPPDIDAMQRAKQLLSEQRKV